jgi:hypothetical protein
MHDGVRQHASPALVSACPGTLTLIEERRDVAGSPEESDVVEVMETRDGTGTFMAHIKILRFRLRMRVSKCVVVEFVASGAFVSLRFSRADPHSPLR